MASFPHIASHRRGARLTVAALALCACFAGVTDAQAGKKKKGTTVKDLYYGEVLFHFYQQHDFEALTKLLVARHAARLPNHTEEAELLLGGLYLAYGQHEQAGAIFARLLNEYQQPKIDPGIDESLKHFVQTKKDSVPDAFV